MKGKKLLSLLLMVVMLISCFTVLANEYETQTVYKASDAWYVPTGDDLTTNTYNGHTEWTWERKDSGKDWFDFAKFNTGKQAFGMTPPNVIGTDNRTAGNAWTTSSGSWNHPAVGEGWMLPYMQSGNPDYAVSKTFTAPMSGTVELSTENGYIYGGSSNPGVTNNRTAFVRITVNNQQIWPADGKQQRIPENNGQIYKFDKVTIKIYKGDKLRFEVYNGDSDAQYGKHVYWKPVVTYTDNSEGTVYNSYTTLNANISNKIVTGDSEWSWKNYRADTTNGFVDFNGVSDTATASMHLFVLPENADGTHNYNYQGINGTDNTNAMYSTIGVNYQNAYNVMSRYWMRTTVSNGKMYADNSVAKVFTAPKSGIIRISAVDADGNSKIYGKKVATIKTSGASIFIKKVTDGTAPSPSDTTGSLYNYKFKFTSTSSATPETIPIDFSPMAVHINEGEQLWFIVNAADTESGNAKFVHWNPVVSYYSYDPFEIELDNESVHFTSSGEELTDFDSIVSNSSVAVNADARFLNVSQIPDGETRTAVMCAVVYDSNGNIIGSGISNAANITQSSGQNHNFVIDSLNITQNAENGFIKLFVFDGMSSLNPFSPIGNENIYTSANFASSETEVHIRGFLSYKEAGMMASAALYTSDADLNNISSADIKYINQTVVGDDGSFEFCVPLTALEAQNCTLVSNFNCALYSKDIPIYCSSLGTEDGLGTKESPVTFQRALELAENGGTIIVDGNVVLPEDFVWQTATKAITVSGKDSNAVLDITAIADFNINTDATFENITIGCAEADAEGNGVNKIYANGNHVIIKESVKTPNVIKLISGGSSKKSVSSVNLEVYGGNYNTILGGSNSDGGGAVSVNGDCKLTVGGNVNSDCNDTNWDNQLRKAVIHGGGYGGSIQGDCILTLKGNAKAKYVYGGQNGLNASSTVGKVIVNVEGGSFMNVFAVLKNTKSENSVAVNEPVTAKLTMTGGKVESLMGAQEAVSGSITINALGGTVTRRIIGGCYNEIEKASSNDSYVSGSTVVIIGEGLNGMTYKGYSRGIYPGSRTAQTYENEVSTIIFTGGSYDKFGNMITDTYHNDLDLSKSKYDYLVTGTKGGSITVTDNTNIVITPDSGYNAWINNKAFDGENYTLQDKDTNVDFAVRINEEGIVSLGYKANEEDTVLSVKYNVNAQETSIIIAALYDSENSIVSIDSKEVNSGEGSADLNLTANVEDGKNYKMRIMIWKSWNNLTPRCKFVEKLFPSVN